MSLSSGCRKRKPPPEVIAADGSGEKRRKMEPCMIQHCFCLLDELENHPVSGQLFNQTYDDRSNPVYDTVTRNPMDLGIIRFNLQNNTYCRIQEFQADLTLAFDNAMLYKDVPASNVLRMTEEVKKIIQERWKTLKEIYPDQENMMFGKVDCSSVRSNSEYSASHFKLSKSEEKIEFPKPKENCARDSARKRLRDGGELAQGSIRHQSLCRGTGKCSSGPIETRQKMEPCMVQQCFTLLEELKKYPVAGRLFSIQTVDDQELNGILHARWTSLKDYWQDNAEKLKVSRVRSNSSDEVPKPRQNCARKLAREGMTSRSRSRSIGKASPPSSLGARKCNSCGSMKCQCNTNGSNRASSRSNVISDRSVGRKSVSNASNKHDYRRKSREPSLDCASGNVHIRSRLTVTRTVTADPGKRQHENENSERRLCKEKEKVEDRSQHVKASGKTRWDREREAARIALQKMGNSAGIEMNLVIQNELEVLCGGSLPGVYPLHRLGLFLKDTYSEDEIEGDDEADMYDDIEEGEIV